MNRIVVIEDDPTIRRGLADNLRANAYEVTTAANGEDGYRMVLEFGERTARVQQAVLGFSWLDGETLAVGLALEAALGEAVGVTTSGVYEYVCDLLQEVGLPTELDGEIDSGRFFENAARLAGLEGAGYALLSDVGRVAGSPESGWVHDIADETVHSVVFG